MREAKRNKDVLSEELDDEFIPEDARPVCFKCLRPCDRLQYYCGVCGSSEAINPLASYMPFVRIPFNIGMAVKACRMALYDKETSMIFRFICLFAFIMFVLVLAV
jgi:hypothetical protein